MFDLKKIEEINKREKRTRINNICFLLSQYFLLGIFIAILSILSYETQAILNTLSSYNSNEYINTEALLNQFLNFSNLTFLIFCFSFFIVNINQSLKINYNKKGEKLNSFFLGIILFLASLLSLFFIIINYNLIEGSLLYDIFYTVNRLYSIAFSIPLFFFSILFEYFGLDIYNPNFFIVFIFSKFLIILVFLYSLLKKIMSGIDLSVSHFINHKEIHKKIESINDSILKNNQKLTMLLESNNSKYPSLYKYVNKNETKIRRILLDKNKEMKKKLEKENIIENI